MAGDRKSRPSDDIWHLSIEDLFTPDEEPPRADGGGPFVINLRISDTPIGPPPKGFRRFESLRVYQLIRSTGGRRQYLLRLGVIRTALEADAILEQVREHYPRATRDSAVPDDHAAIAKAAAAAAPPSRPPPGKTADRHALPPPRIATRPVRKPSKQPEPLRIDIDDLLPELKDLDGAPPRFQEARHIDPNAVTDQVEVLVLDRLTGNGEVPSVRAVSAPNESPEISESPMFSETPDVDDAPVIGDAPVTSDAPLVDVAPVVKEAQAIAEIPVLSEAAIAMPDRDEASVGGETPVQGKIPVLSEVIAASESSVAEEAPAVDAAAAPNESAAIDASPVVREEPLRSEMSALRELLAPAEVSAVDDATETGEAPIVRAASIVEDAPGVGEAPRVAVAPTVGEAEIVAQAPVRSQEAIVERTPVVAPVAKPSEDPEPLDQFIARLDKLMGAAESRARGGTIAPNTGPARDVPAHSHAGPPAVDSTQTMRALTPIELADGEASHWFAIQLALGEEPIDAGEVPNLDIFEEYRLYAVTGLKDDRAVHALRVGFFSSKVAAETVAGYLCAFFDTPCIKRVSSAERERFAERCMKAGKDVGAAGAHTAIELAEPAPVKMQRAAPARADAARRGAAESPSLWSRLVAPRGR